MSKLERELKFENKAEQLFIISMLEFIIKIQFSIATWKVQMVRGGVNSLFKNSTNFTKQVS